MKKVVDRKNLGSLNGAERFLFVDLIAIPAILTPSAARDCRLTSGGIPCNALCWGAKMASGGLRHMLLETTPS